MPVANARAADACHAGETKRIVLYGVAHVAALDNLAGATSVRFGTKAGTITAGSATSITVTSPSESVGTVDATVTTAPDFDAGDHELPRDTGGRDPELLGHLGDGQSLVDTAEVDAQSDGASKFPPVNCLTPLVRETLFGQIRSDVRLR